MSDSSKVILSGMRPTGKLHLGHYEGALKNYLKLQASGAECYFMVADYHALSTEYKNPQQLGDNSLELVLDWLAVGLDPKRATLFVQSDVSEHAELFTILGMLTPLAWAERCPTYKEQQQELADKDIANYGFLGYPILQAADILLYRATHVPVGQDQLPHLEMTREIGRRFNFLYREIWPEPDAMLTESPKVPGIDGRKMSKSYGNAIALADTPAEVEAKVKSMYTDPQKIRANTPGQPDKCVVLAFCKIYASEAAEQIERECRAGERGCVACKKQLLPNLLAVLEPIRTRREALMKNLDPVRDILADGARQAKARAQETMKLVREAMKWPVLTAGRRNA